MKSVPPERNGWRDEALSIRHRNWGFDCPAVDIDFLLTEYDSGKAVALIEYKNEHAAPQFASHPSYQALSDLGSRARLPFIVCRYASDFSVFKARAINLHAKMTLYGMPEEFNERGWVELLYRIRGRKMPTNLFKEAA